MCGGGGERSYHNMEPMLLNVSVVERLQITSSECHKRCHMHTAATFALADENKMVSKLLDRCLPADKSKAKLGGSQLMEVFQIKKNLYVAIHMYVFRLAYNF